MCNFEVSIDFGSILNYNKKMSKRIEWSYALLLYYNGLVIAKMNTHLNTEPL